MIYRFNQHILDTESLELKADADVITLEPQVFLLLQYLIENRGRAVLKDDIIGAVWDGRIVSDSALSYAIKAARVAVGDDGKKQTVIRTLHRRGFRFVADVTEGAPTANTETPQASAQTSSNNASIAVLPFDNLSGDPEQDFICDGISADIIAGLSRIGAFFVIARNSTFQYKGTSPDVRQVATDLGVRYVLEGSVQSTKDRMRISVQLIDGGAGQSLWAERYDRNFQDLFDVQDEITASIIAQLEPELSRAEVARSKSRPPENLDAWGLYHRGMLALRRHTKDDLQQACDLFEDALRRDPTFASAHAGLSWCWSEESMLGFFTHDPAKIIERARKAVQIDDRNAVAHLALSWGYFIARQIEPAIDEANKALQINPNFAYGHVHLAAPLVHSGRAAEGIPHVELAIKLSPADPSMAAWRTRLAIAHLYMEDHELAAETARQSAQIWDVWLPQSILTAALAHLDRADEAALACHELERRQPGITISFVQTIYPTVHQPSLNHFLSGLRKAGLAE